MIRDKENHTNTITMAIIAVQINFTWLLSSYILLLESNCRQSNTLPFLLSPIPELCPSGNRMSKTVVIIEYSNYN
jgi:hypothetical protein